MAEDHFFFSSLKRQQIPGDTENKARSAPSPEKPELKPGAPRFAPIPENNYKITDAVTLQMVEDVAGGLRAHEFRVGDAYIPGKFDTVHLRAIHGYVMQDVYAAPGATRNDELLLAKLAAKDNPEAELFKDYDSRLGAGGQAITLLATGKVNERLEELSERLAEDNYLRGLEKPVFIERLATYHLEYSATWPFQSGNEHVLGFILNEVGRKAGYEVKSHKSANLREVTYSILEAGVTSDKTKLIQVLNSVTEPGQSAAAEVRRRPTLAAEVIRLFRK
ncbi:MAG TPA: hypothetical protein VFO93_19080 [Hymenobacter sp.]|uniref:hypothetical protein n=1 Tax=Hymenobacter sp. TaxID=1898978 RepID=UPI002D8000E5|nr:hypothetical protein [Hymenobacter sp.]HET9505656.1 hypothetical protein [Hymenobacter sp.]